MNGGSEASVKFQKGFTVFQSSILDEEFSEKTVLPATTLQLVISAYQTSFCIA